MIATIAALALTACSSSGSKAGSTSGSAAGTAAGTATGAASSGAASSGAANNAADVNTDQTAAAAAATVEKYSALPTGLTVTAPLPSAPATGKSVVFLQCEVTQCKDGGDGFRAGAAAVGWKTTTLSWKTTDPASLVAAMQQALTLSPKPYAVSISGLPQALWGSQEAAYAKAGVLLIPWSLGPVTLTKTIIAEVLSPADIMLQGKLLADWFIADSKGKGKVLVQGVPQYPSIDEEATGFRDEVAAACPGCSVSKLDVTGSQVASNGVTGAIVSALQRDPSIKYMASADIALAPGLPAALKTAGIHVKILGGAATPIDEQGVRDGTIAVVMKNDLVYAGWLMIDVLVRHAAGLPVAPNGGGIVQQILTKATIAPAGSTALIPADYPDLFKKLWQVS